MRSLMIPVALLVAAATLNAQNPDDEVKRQLAERKAVAEYQGMEFKMAMERVPLEKSVKGAPYSAETVTETNQTLADGNRISRKSTGRVYRDGEGRIRREEDRQNGTVAVSIVDGVAGVSYRLEPETRIAWKTSADTSVAIMKELEARRRGEEKKMAAEREIPPPPPPAPPAGALPRSGVPAGDGRKVGPLERKMMEGILVEGRKSTSVIPAGQIGNEQPMTITSEEWRSPELNVLVMTHHTDPRMGETSYRLTNIVRGEPDPSLFQVPAGYTIKETGIKREMHEEH